MLSIEARLKECLNENEELKSKLRNYEDEDKTLVASTSQNPGDLAAKTSKVYEFFARILADDININFLIIA